MLRLLLALVLCSRVQPQVFDPTGVYFNVAESQLLEAQELECSFEAYNEPYSHPTRTADIAKSTSSAYEYILVGARRSGSSILSVAAIGIYDEVFRPTSSIASAALGTGSVYWYMYSGYAFGFAPMEKINLRSADTEELGCELRMSWHLDNGRGGWSVGCEMGLGNATRKVVKYCNSIKTGPAAGLDRMAYQASMLMRRTTGVWTWAANATTNAGPPIRIGTAVTLDCCSTHAGMGLTVARAYMLFVEWLNNVRGGVRVGGQVRPINLTLIDDRSDPDLVYNITKHLVDEEGIKLLLGPYGSPLSTQAAAVAHSRGALMITPQATSATVYKDRPMVFGTALPSAQRFSTALVEYAQHGARTIGIVRDERFPKAACDAVYDNGEALGMEVLLDYSFAEGGIETDIDAFFELLSQSGRTPGVLPDVLIGCTYDGTCRRVVSEISKRGLDFQGLSFTVCVTANGWLSAMGESGRFVTGIAPWIPSFNLTSDVVNGWTSLDFASAFRRAYDAEPPYQAATSWAACVVLVTAIERADSLDPVQIADVMRDMDLKTLYGRVSFNEDGLNSDSWKVVQIFTGPVDSTFDPKLVAPPSNTSQQLVYPMPPWKDRPCFVYPDNGDNCDLGLSATGCGTCPPLHGPYWRPDAWHGSPGCLCVPLQCQAGYVRTGTMGTCEPCPAGHYAVPSGICVKCAPGKYASTEASAECAPCPKGTASKTVGATHCSECDRGEAAPSTNSLECQDCRRGTFSDATGASICTLCPPGKATELMRSQNCSNCPGGTFSIWGGHGCAMCPIGTYQSAEHTSACRDCPVGASCTQEGMSLPMNKDDWWLERLPDGSEEYHPCTHSGICKERLRCAEGHTGPLCLVCLPGYSQSPECRKCENWYMYIGMAALCFVGTVIIAYVTTVVAVSSVAKGKAITDALLKLLFNYLTTISITASVFHIVFVDKIVESSDHSGRSDSTVPMMFNAFLKASITELLLPLFPVGCVFQPGLEPEDQEWIDQLAGATHEMLFDEALKGPRAKLRDYHWQQMFRMVVFWFAAPVVLVLVLVLVGFTATVLDLGLWRSYYEKVLAFHEVYSSSEEDRIEAIQEAGKGLNEETIIQYLEAPTQRLMGLYPSVRLASNWENSTWDFLNRFQQESQPLVVVTLFLVYPSLVQNFLEPLRCERPLGERVGDVMSMSTDLKCYQVDDVLFWLAVLGFLFFSLGLPAVSTWRLYTHDRHDPRIQRTWGFLTSGYEINTSYWECLLLFRKSITVLIVSVRVHEGFRVLLLLLIASMFSLMHIWYQPFDNRYDELLDRVETRHLIIWVLFCLAILWTYLMGHTEHNTATRNESRSVIVVAVAMAVLHGWFIIMILRQVVKHGSVSFAERLVRKESNQDFIRHKMHLGLTGITLTNARGRLHRVSELSDTDSSEGRPSDWRPSERTRRSGRTSVATVAKSVYTAMRDSREATRLERKFFGRWAERHWAKYLDHKPCIACDASRMWFSILGNHSYMVKPNHLRQADRLSEVRLPGSTKVATEKQRQYLLKIVIEAFEYIVVNQNIQVFSASLLEFIFRVGFAFDSSGRPRREVDNELHFEEMTLSKALGRAESDVSSIDEPRGFEAESLSAGQVPSRARTLGAQTRMKTGTLGGRGAASSETLFSEAKSVIDESRLRVYVEEMLDPSIFDRAITLEELQMNLNMLRAWSERNLQIWLELFELEWYRARSVQLQKWKEHLALRQKASDIMSGSDLVDGKRVEASKLNTERSLGSVESGELSTPSNLKEEDPAAGNMLIPEEPCADSAQTETHDDLGQLTPLQPGPPAVLVRVTIDDSVEARHMNSEVARQHSSCLEVKPRSEMSHRQTSASASEGGSSQSPRRMMLREPSSLPPGVGASRQEQIEEHWSNFGFSLLYSAEVRAARMPAHFVLSKVNRLQEQSRKQVQSLRQQVAKAQENVDAARVRNEAMRETRDREVTIEAQQLRLIREAIKEAEEEVQQLRDRVKTGQAAEEEALAGRRRLQEDPGTASDSIWAAADSVADFVSQQAQDLRSMAATVLPTPSLVPGVSTLVAQHLPAPPPEGSNPGPSEEAPRIKAPRAGGPQRGCETVMSDCIRRSG